MKTTLCLKNVDRFRNGEHRHSGIRFVTPDERHAGRDKIILARRHEVYSEARDKYPYRWRGRARRKWEPVGTVWLNPDNELPTSTPRAA